MNRHKYTEANRKAWNQVAPIHRKSRNVDLAAAFGKSGYSTLDKTITAKFQQIGLCGKQVAQLGCNNGREILSLVNLGARHGVGFDISDEVIKEARELNNVAGLDCTFVRSDVYAIGNEYDSIFDLVYISIGALTWMPDLPGFFAVASRLLKSGGKLVLYEQHPFQFMLATADEDEYDSANPMKIAYSYFRQEVWENADGLDYYGKSKYKSEPSYCFTIKVSDIVNAMVGAKIILRELHEYPHDISNEFTHLQDRQLLPLSLLLVGEKS